MLNISINRKKRFFHHPNEVLVLFLMRSRYNCENLLFEIALREILFDELFITLLGMQLKLKIQGINHFRNTRWIQKSKIKSTSLFNPGE